MIEALVLVGPLFAIVLVGWTTAKFAVFPPRGLDGLNAFIFKIALPAMLFRIMSNAPDMESARMAAPYILIYGGATLVIYVAARLIGRVFFGLKGGADVIHAHLAANGNVGFVGLPLIAVALGTEAAFPAALALTFDLLVIMTVTTISLESTRRSGDWRTGLRRGLVNPILIASFAGIAWGYWGEHQLGLALARPIAVFVDTLAQAAAPAALFTTGATLALRKLDHRMTEFGSVVVLKLIAHPFLVIGMFFALAPNTPALWVATAVLIAANPSSNNAVIFAGFYRIYEARASSVVLATTALSIITFAGFVAWLRIGL